MATLTLSDIVARYGSGQVISLQTMTGDFNVDDFTVYDVMSAPHHQFSAEWTPRMVEEDNWTISPTREVMAEALEAAANGSWITWQDLAKITMKHPCDSYLGTAIAMAAQPEGFKAADGAVYRAAAEAPNRIKVWKE